MQKIPGPAAVWAALSIWPWTASGQAGGDQPPTEQPSAPTAMTAPAMTGPLAANPNPMSFDAGPFGPVYLTGSPCGRFVRTNLDDDDPARLWHLNLQLVSIEEAFRNLKGDRLQQGLFR